MFPFTRASNERSPTHGVISFIVYIFQPWHDGGCIPAPCWGANIVPPLLNFLDSSKTAQISTQNFQYLPQHQFDVYHQNFRKTHYFLENDVLVTSCFGILGLKNAECSKAARMFRFEVRRNRKMSNGLKLNTLQSSYLGFSISIDFEPENPKFHFFRKLLPLKSKMFKLSKKSIYICD